MILEEISTYGEVMSFRFTGISKFLCLIAFIIATMSAANAAIAFPQITVGMNNANTPQEFTNGIQIMIMLTILTLAPSIFILTTAFTRIIIVLALTRQALGTPTLPPNQVLAGLALILTFFVMAPTINKINETAWQPYVNNQISQQVALDRAIKPIRAFMIKYSSEHEIGLFVKLSGLPRPKNIDEVPTYVLLPSFILSELKTAFKIGFIVFLPFLVIDIVVASILVSMGMMFLPPSIVATPFKIILFVMVDGWYLVTKSLMEGFIL